VPSARRPRMSGTILSREQRAIPLPIASSEGIATTCDMFCVAMTSVRDQIVSCVKFDRNVSSMVIANKARLWTIVLLSKHSVHH
jgi:hypothetical protein